MDKHNFSRPFVCSPESPEKAIKTFHYVKEICCRACLGLQARGWSLMSPGLMMLFRVLGSASRRIQIKNYVNSTSRKSFRKKGFQLLESFWEDRKRFFGQKWKLWAHTSFRAEKRKLIARLLMFFSSFAREGAKGKYFNDEDVWKARCFTCWCLLATLIHRKGGGSLKCTSHPVQT